MDPDGEAVLCILAGSEGIQSVHLAGALPATRSVKADGIDLILFVYKVEISYGCRSVQLVTFFHINLLD